MMLWLHLFNSVSKVSGLHHYIYINDKPLATWLTQGCSPVGFFIFLSGFGLYYAHKKGTNRNRILARVKKIYFNYWFVLIPFLITAYLIYPEKYNIFNLHVLSTHLTAFNPYYNGEYWFLFPYIITVLLSPILFRISDFYSHKAIFLPALVLLEFGILAVIKYGGSPLYSNMWIYTPVLVISMIPTFIIGSIFNKYDLFDRSYRYISQWICLKSLRIIFFIAILIAAFILRCITNTAALSLVFVPLMTFSIYSISNNIVNLEIFEKLGIHSMNIWLSHTWICGYLFNEELYSLGSPPLIFIVLIIASYLISVIINFFQHYVMILSNFRLSFPKF